MSGIEIKGLEEYLEKFKAVQKKASDRIKRQLDKMGGDLKENTEESSPEISGKLIKGYKLDEVKEFSKNYQISVYNNARHAHLVEKGHRLVLSGGKDIGWVDGLFILEKEVAKYNLTMNMELYSWMNELYKELM